MPLLSLSLAAAAAAAAADRSGTQQELLEYMMTGARTRSRPKIMLGQHGHKKRHHLCSLYHRTGRSNENLAQRCILFTEYHTFFFTYISFRSFSASLFLSR